MRPSHNNFTRAAAILGIPTADLIQSFDRLQAAEVEIGPEQRIRDVAVSLVVGGYMSSGHDLERKIRQAERELLEFACDEIKRHMALHDHAMEARRTR